MWPYSQIKSDNFMASVTLVSNAKWIKVHYCTEPQVKQLLLPPSETSKLNIKAGGVAGQQQ
jgi:hypothetical protein